MNMATAHPAAGQGSPTKNFLLTVVTQTLKRARRRAVQATYKEKKQYLLNLADVYILPSFIEGVPISILEAESYHKPVITTNVGGIPSIVQDCVSGVFVTPGNDKEIYLAMKMMAESEELRQKYGEASYRISRDYQPEAIKKELIGCYDKILKTSNIR